jgi:hypothetical protein
MAKNGGWGGIEVTTTGKNMMKVEKKTQTKKRSKSKEI